MPLMEKLPFGVASLPSAGSSKRVILSYIFDYVIIIVLIVGFLALDAIEPYHQEFSLRNYTLQYKYAVNERVPNLALVTIAVVSPIGIIILWTLVVDGIFSHRVDGIKRKYSLKQRLWELNCGLLGLGLSISLQYVIVASLKNAIGKPRPDLIDRCKPKEDAKDPSPFGLSNISICNQNTHAILKDGFRSFPSGHSSTSFGGLYYLSLYFAGKLHILDSRGEVWKLFVVLTPSLGAALVAGSRIMDARHHPFDVLSGSLIGIVVAWAAYRQYFPSISDFRAKGRAFPMRTWGRGSLGNRGKEIDESSIYESAYPQDEEHVNVGSSMIRGTSPHSQSTNIFRDEMSSTQRLRRFESSRKPVGSPRNTSPLPLLRHGKSASPRREGRDDGWENVAVNETRSADEYELQPQHPLGVPAGQAFEPPDINDHPAFRNAKAPAENFLSTGAAEGKTLYPASTMTKIQPKPAADETIIQDDEGRRHV